MFIFPGALGLPEFTEEIMKFEWKKISPETLMTLETCAQVMYELDGVIGDIESQLYKAATDARETGEYSDSIWYNDAKRALKDCKRKRQAIQERKGFLCRRIRDSAQRSIERRFVDAAMIVLPKEQVQAVWGEVHKNDADTQSNS